MPNFATNASLPSPQYNSFDSRYGKRTQDFTVALFSLICLLIVIQRTSPFFL